MSNNYSEHLPFISCIKCMDKEYVGIIINFDDNIVSIYDLSMIVNPLERQNFLELGDVWWWESNRKIPINIFLKNEMIVFRPYIKTFNSKDSCLIFGPSVNLSELSERRIKRKSIQLVRSVRNIRS